MINIVIPALNEEHYIGSLLKSLTRQNYKRFNVTLIDARSRDKTVEIAEQYRQKLSLTVLSTPKRNVSHQRNLGALHGDAPYILFLDADVILHPNFLKQLVHDIKKRDLANCWLIPISEKQIDKVLYNLYNVVFLEFGKYIWPVAVGNNLFTTRKLFEKVGGFDESIKTWEDIEYLQRAIASGGRFAILRRPKIYTSVRRFEMQGRLNYLMENLKGLQYAIRTGRMPSHIHYPMGLDYSKLHLDKRGNSKAQKRLAEYYRTYLNRATVLIRERLLPANVDAQSQKAIKEIVQTFRRLLS